MAVLLFVLGSDRLRASAALKTGLVPLPACATACGGLPAYRDRVLGKLRQVL